MGIYLIGVVGMFTIFIFFVGLTIGSGNKENIRRIQEIGFWDVFWLSLAWPMTLVFAVSILIGNYINSGEEEI